MTDAAQAAFRVPFHAMIASLVLLAALAGPAHSGFFLRADLGGGFLSSSEPATVDNSGSTISSSAKMTGPAGSVGISVGAGLFEGFAVYGWLQGISVKSPSNDLHVCCTTSLGLGIIGGGVTWYFANHFFVSAAAGAAQMTQSSVTPLFGQYDYHPHWGPAGRIGAGAEWQLGGSDVGLGLAIYLNAARNQDLQDSGCPTCVQYTAPTWTTVMPSLAASLTWF